MPSVQIVRCPTCGNLAERRLLSDRSVPTGDRIIQTSCPVCDYLMIMGLSTGKVIEAYAPGQSSSYNWISIQSRSLVETIAN